MPERSRYRPSQDALETRESVERHFRWSEPQDRFRYAPSPERVLDEEAADEVARQHAVVFVALIASRQDFTDSLTSDDLRAQYESHVAALHSAGEPIVFSLREAWGGAERMRRHLLESARATDDWESLAIARRYHRVCDLIEDALPVDERPLPF